MGIISKFHDIWINIGFLVKFQSLQKYDFTTKTMSLILRAIQCAFTGGGGSIPYHGGVLTQHLDIYVGRLRCIQIVQYRMSLEMCMDCPSAAEPSQAAVSR